MTKTQAETLVRDLEANYKYYHGWHFSYEHPGAFVYNEMGGGDSVYFTPDWDDDGAVSIMVTDQHGNVVESEEIPYSALSAYELFGIVRPFLDRRMR